MDASIFDDKTAIDENIDLEFSIKNNIIIGKPTEEYFEKESIGTLLLKSLNNFPNHIGQINVHTGEKTTFSEFKDRSIRCALWLRNQGVGKGDVVSTSISIQNDDYVPILAAIFIGAVVNPWPYQLTPPAAKDLFKLVQPKIMFVWDEGIEMLVKAAKDVQVDCKFVVVGKHPDYPSLSDIMAEQHQADVDQFQHVEPKDPKKQVGALMFTSGTTSKPKAVMVPYEAFVKNRCCYFTRPHSNFLTYTHLTWTVGLYLLTRCIRYRLTRILHSEFDVEETGAVIEKFQVNGVGINPTKLTQMYKSGIFNKYDFSKLETIVLFGTKPVSSILEKARNALPNTHIYNCFGLTETAFILTVQTKKSETRNSIGLILGGVQLKIIDPNSGLALAANQTGELWFKDDYCMLGYFNNPEETKQMIDDEGWLHTGDLGYYDENGEIWITDRIKHIINYQGSNLSPSKIEEVLLQHPAVADVAVVPVPHEIDFERPFAFIVKKPGAEVTLEELKELPASYDESIRLIGGAAFISEIPYNANGKKRINDLKRMAQSYVEK